MNEPNPYLVQRRALARFRKYIPFLTLIPNAIYHKLSPLPWYEPFGEIEQFRQDLEKELDCYLMPYKRFEPDIPWEAQLFVYIEEANLSPEKQAILDEMNDISRRIRIRFEAFQKPLKIRKRPLEHPFAHCDPPDEEQPELPDDVDPNDIPF